MPSTNAQQPSRSSTPNPQSESNQPNVTQTKLSATATHNLPPSRLQRNIYWYIVNNLACDPCATPTQPHLGEFIPHMVNMSRASAKTLYYTQCILERMVEKPDDGAGPGASQRTFLRAFELARGLLSFNEVEEIYHCKDCDECFRNRWDTTQPELRSHPINISNGWRPQDYNANSPSFDQAESEASNLTHDDCEECLRNCNKTPELRSHPAADTPNAWAQGPQDYARNQQPYFQHYSQPGNYNPSGGNRPVFVWNPQTGQYNVSYGYTQNGENGRNAGFTYPQAQAQPYAGY